MLISLGIGLVVGFYLRGKVSGKKKGKGKK